MYDQLVLNQCSQSLQYGHNETPCEIISIKKYNFPFTPNANNQQFANSV